MASPLPHSCSLGQDDWHTPLVTSGDTEDYEHCSSAVADLPRLVVSMLGLVMSEAISGETGAIYAESPLVSIFVRLKL